MYTVTHSYCTLSLLSLCTSARKMMQSINLTQEEGNQLLRGNEKTHLIILMNYLLFSKTNMNFPLINPNFHPMEPEEEKDLELVFIPVLSLVPQSLYLVCQRKEHVPVVLVLSCSPHTQAMSSPDSLHLWRLSQIH